MANFFRIGAGSLNWSNVGSWSSTSGGSSNGSAQPTSSDNVTFDTNSPATVTVAATASANTLTLNKASLVITLNGGSLTASSTTSVSTAATINKTAAETVTMTGLSVQFARLTGTAKVILTGGTWTGSNAGGTGINNDLDLQGNITLVNGSTSNYGAGTITYVSGTITVTNNIFKIDVAGATLNLNGITFNALTIGANCTLSSNIACSGTLTPAATVNSTTSETITTSGGITTTGANSQGTAKIIFTGGTWTGSVQTIVNSIDIQGNVTIGSVRYGDLGTGTGGKTLKYVSGTVTSSGGNILFVGNATIDLSGVTLDCSITSVTVATVITLASNFTTTSTFTPGVGTTINKTTSETFTCSGMGINSSTIGTAKIILAGGTWSGTSTTGIANNVDIQGNVTISGTIYYTTGTLTYVSGTITTTGSTLTLQTSCTLNTNTISWNNITTTNTTGQTYTINSLLTATGTFTIGTGTATTFAGTSGFTVATLSCAATSAITITLKNSVTYTITTAFTCFTSRTGAIVLFTSDDGTLKAILTLTNPSTCNVLASFTRIDASGGRSIVTFNGTITSCNNIVERHDVTTIIG